MYTLRNQVSNVPDAGSLPQSSTTQNVAPQSNSTPKSPPLPPPPPIIRQSRQTSHTITSEMIQVPRSAENMFCVSRNDNLRMLLPDQNRPSGASTSQPNNGKFHSLNNLLLIQMINQSKTGQEVRPIGGRPISINSDRELVPSPRLQRNLLSLSPGLSDVPDHLGNTVSSVQ